MAFWLETKTEYWDTLPVQYLRRTGAYGRENTALMAEMKNRITEKGLWQEDTTIWAVPWDNPQTTPPHMGSALGQSTDNATPSVPLRCVHPRSAESA